VRIPEVLGRNYFDDVEDSLIEEMARLALADSDVREQSPEAPGITGTELYKRVRMKLIRRTLNSFPRVCRRFWKLAARFTFWKDFDLAIVANKLHRFSDLPVTAFEDLFRPPARLLECTRLSGAELPGGLAAAIASRMPNLRYLSIATADAYNYVRRPPEIGVPGEIHTIPLDGLLGALAAGGTVQSLCMSPNPINSPTPVHEHAFGSLAELECCPGVAAHTTAPELTRLAIDTRVGGLYDPAPTLARFPKLRDLKIINGTDTIDIRATAPIPGIESLDLECAALAMNPGDIERAFGTVRDARFAVEAITTELWLDIWNLRNLRKLSIGTRRTSMADFAAVWQDPPGVEPLADLKLESLRFDPTPLFASRRCRSLQRLSLRECDVPTPAAYGLKTLKYLSVTNSHNPDFTAAAIKAATGLQEVRIDDESGDAFTKPLAEANTSVTRLSLRSKRYFPNLKDPRLVFPSLRVLTMDVSWKPGIADFLRMVVNAVETYYIVRTTPESPMVIHASVAREITPTTTLNNRRMTDTIHQARPGFFKIVYTFP
jgi:hypothetical protein